MDPLIRRARPTDVRVIAGFQTACWREAYRGLVPQDYLDRVSVADRERRWRDRLDSGSRSIAVSDSGSIDGVVSWAVSSTSEPGLPSLELAKVDPDTAVRENRYFRS